MRSPSKAARLRSNSKLPRHSSASPSLELSPKAASRTGQKRPQSSSVSAIGRISKSMARGLSPMAARMTPDFASGPAAGGRPQFGHPPAARWTAVEQRMANHVMVPGFSSCDPARPGCARYGPFSGRRTARPVRRTIRCSWPTSSRRPQPPVVGPSTSGVGTEPASFRDPASTVFYLDGHVLRGLSKQGAADYEALTATRFFPQAVQAGQIVGTRTVPEEELPAADGDSSWAMVLEHDRIPVVSYPYEWTFSMLKAAALLHLDLLQQGLAEGQTMKDGYAYNLQFVGARPVFIDVGSFEQARPGEPWAGYRQFCQTFLYPLLLTAYKGVRFQPWLRGAVQGIAPGDIRPLFTGFDVFKRGVLKHVVLHQAMDARFSKARASDTRRELQRAGFSTELQAATVKAIRKLVAGLRWKAGESAWSDYQRTSTYSRVAAEHAGYVVAADSDDLTVDLLFQALSKEGERRILPITLDLCDP